MIGATGPIVIAITHAAATSMVTRSRSVNIAVIASATEASAGAAPRRIRSRGIARCMGQATRTRPTFCTNGSVAAA